MYQTISCHSIRYFAKNRFQKSKCVILFISPFIHFLENLLNNDLYKGNNYPSLDHNVSHIYNIENKNRHMLSFFYMII